MSIATLIETIFAGPPPVRIEAYDGSVVEADPGSAAKDVTVYIRRREAIARVLRAPGELGLVRAYVAGDLDVDGDLDALFSLQAPSLAALAKPDVIRSVLTSFGSDLARAPAPPSSEAHPRGLLHSRRRDRAAVTHHYDVSNEFYELFLGPTMVYSCGVFRDGDDSLENAQRRKVDLVARKLGLREGMRLLDVGCGWGTMAIHAAKNYGCHVVGVTLSQPQRDYAEARAKSEGVDSLVEFRVQDYRDVSDGPFDAISSIGMAEHVGRRGLSAYAQNLFDLLAPGGRLLNHAIGRPLSFDDDPRPSQWSEFARQVQFAAGVRRPSKTGSALIERYVFPDGELHEVGTIVSLLQAHGFEVRHLESLREHYALTLRHWVANLETHREEAIANVGEERYRIWRLYMAGSAVGFERHHLEIHQVLAVKSTGGVSGLLRRPHFEPEF